jgi:tetratricopeptide (TPR) repeat protein
MNSKKLPETVRVDLATAPVVITTCWSTQCRLSKSSVPKNTGLRNYLETFDWYDLASYTCSADCVHAAESFAAAFNVLRAFAMDPNAPLRTFTQRAAAWRALATKPPIPEEVNVQRLMAEDAIKENKPDEALSYFENGIELYPTWPEGNFNAALIAGDLGYYADAIEHMQAYLELVPNAADAQAARDKILIWQVKSKQ